jgi:hypothetical protein
MQVLRMTHCLIIVTICAKYLSIFKILWYLKKLWTRHKIYPLTDYVNLWPPSVTLALNCCTWHIVSLLWTIMASIYKIPQKMKTVMVQTRHIPSNRQCWPWMSKFDLDRGGRGLVGVHDTSSHDNKHLCQVIADPLNKWQSYGPDTKVWQTDGRTDGWSLFLYPPFFFEKAGYKNYVSM